MTLHLQESLRATSQDSTIISMREHFLHLLDQVLKTNEKAKRQAHLACTARILPFRHLFVNVSDALKITLCRARLKTLPFCVTPALDFVGFCPDVARSQLSVIVSLLSSSSDHHLVLCARSSAGRQVWFLRPNM